METTKRTVGDNIRELRELHGLTLWKLAELSKVDYNTLKQWEKGTRSPQVVLLARVAVSLMVPLERLLKGVRLSW